MSSRLSIGSFHSSPFLPRCLPWALASALMVSVPLLLSLGAIAGRPESAMAQSAPARPTLQTGSEGPAVREIQSTLKLMGLYASPVDGVYGPGTATAVSQFQRSAGLPADGVVGPETWNRLFPASPGTAVLPPATAASGGFPVPTGMAPTPTPAPVAIPAPVTATATPAIAASAAAPTAAAPTLVTLPILRLGMSGPAVEGLQTRLQALKLFRGAIDGAFGPETQTAVKAAQRQLKLAPDGIVGPATWLGLLR